MTSFENLDRFLEPDYDSNYWSDDAVLHAEEIARLKELMRLNRLYEMVFANLIKKFGSNAGQEQ